MSFLLCHKPEEGEIELDAEGWITVVGLIGGLAHLNHTATFDEVQEVVRENDKARFQLSPDSTRIRARQGHSVDVDLTLKSTTPPEELFHGTVAKSLRLIHRDGLLRGERAHVHLMAERAAAERAAAEQGGDAPGEPTVLVVHAGAAHRSGWLFYETENNVWLVDHVPPKFLSEE